MSTVAFTTSPLPSLVIPGCVTGTTSANISNISDSLSPTELRPVAVNRAQPRPQAPADYIQSPQLEDLEAKATRKVERYYHQIEILRPLAFEAIQEVIQPWIQQLDKHGTLSDLRRQLEKKHCSLRVSGTLLFSWPKRLLRACLDSHYEALDPEDFEEEWYAHFDLSSSKENGLTVGRWPKNGGGFAYSLIAHHEEIQLNCKDLLRDLDTLHPKVWISFANEIRMGSALDIFKKSLRNLR